jgi:hypothetical protein
MSMSYEPGRDAFASEAVSLQEKMLRLRKQIVEAQQYRAKLDGQGEAGPSTVSDESKGHGASYWRVEKQITDLRIWEMEARMTGLLDSHGD